jgi:hypothetical protein
MHSILRLTAPKPLNLIRPATSAQIFQGFSDKSRVAFRGFPTLSSAPYIAKTIITPQDAIASHVRWKITLLLATRMREPRSDRATRSLEHPEECSIHRWLLSRHTQHLLGTPQHRAVLDLHAAFHSQMFKVATLLRAGDFDQADRLLNRFGPFQESSNSLANAIMALDRPTHPNLPPARKILNK